MIHVECNVMNLQTNQRKGLYFKSFDSIGEFNSWYKIVKSDCDTILNIMFYNPTNLPGRKTSNDVELIKVPRIRREDSI
jgi:hypothetical protein